MVCIFLFANSPVNSSLTPSETTTFSLSPKYAYSDFIFLNRNGEVYGQASLNKAIKRIIRDCNDEQFLKSESPEVLLPNFSCHSLRHTFTTRLCEAGTNIKLMQDILGHQDISTTMNIYADVTKELREKELGNLEAYFAKQKG